MIGGLNKAFWRDRRVLVTGATGLVGSWTVKLLLDLGADPVCLVRDWVPHSELVRSGLGARCAVVHGELCDMALLERTLGEYDVRTVLHLAAQTQVGVAIRNPLSTFESNVAGTWRLLEACRLSPTVEQVVIASSDKAYGPQQELPYDETLPLQGRAPYDVSKSCAALIAFSYAETLGVPVCATMCGNFFGPGDLNWNRIVPGTIRSALRDERPIIRSDGQYVRDYFYVKDGAIAYCTLAERMATMPEIRGLSFNFSNERQNTVLELVELILRLMGKEHLQPIVHNEATNEIRRQFLSARRVREMLGWRPVWELEAALRETIDWYRELLA
jgi:CDP-glucose 4,6-dehydratase